MLSRRKSSGDPPRGVDLGLRIFWLNHWKFQPYIRNSSFNLWVISLNYIFMAGITIDLAKKFLPRGVSEGSPDDICRDIIAGPHGTVLLGIDSFSESYYVIHEKISIRYISSLSDSKILKSQLIPYNPTYCLLHFSFFSFLRKIMCKCTSMTTIIFTHFTLSIFIQIFEKVTTFKENSDLFWIGGLRGDKIWTHFYKGVKNWSYQKIPIGKVLLLIQYF